MHVPSTDSGSESDLVGSTDADPHESLQLGIELHPGQKRFGYNLFNLIHDGLTWQV